MTADIAEEYYFSYLLDRANRTFLCIASVAGGMEIEQVAARGPGEGRQGRRSTPTRASTRRRPARSSTAAGFPAEVADQVVDIAVKLWQAFVAEDATLVEVNPLAKIADGRVLLPRRQGHPGRERRLPAPRPRGAGGQVRGRPAGAGGQGEGPQLRQARRRGRHHRQRRRPGHVHPRRGRVRGRGVTAASSRPTSSTSAAAPAPQVMANGLEIVLSDPAVKSVFVNVFGGITACDEVANGIVQALALLEQRGEAVTKPLVVRLDGNNAEAGRRDPRRREQPAGRAGGHDGRCGRAGRRARGCGGLTHGYLAHQGLQGHRPGHDRLRGLQAHPPDAAAGTNVVGGVNPRKARPEGRLRRHRRCRSSPRSPRRWRRPAPT